MKRIIPLLLSLLLLCSCANSGANPAVTSDVTASSTAPTAEATTSSTTSSEVTTESVMTTSGGASPATTTEAATSSTASGSSSTEVKATEATTTEATTTEVTTVTVIEEKSPYDGILHADGRKIISPDGKGIQIKGIALGNEVWGNPANAPTIHHTEDTYRELSEMGFNSVRFYLNYGLFEDDDAPYVYKESGFEWLDMNIKWAKENGIGIILNMHYPQGGYQSQGKGGELWANVENQKRLSALWCAIAERYRNEPTIWGYGLVNEPVVLWQGDTESTVEFYRSFVQSLTDDLREVTDQAIFIEKLCAVTMEDGSSDWGLLTIDQAMCLVEGENLIYEFHNYSPHKFTHQNMSWANTAGKTFTYPSDNYAEINITDYWVDCLYAPMVSTDGTWQYREASEVYNGDEEYNIGVLAANAGSIGENGTAYFDDLKVIEISPDGTERVVIEYNFDKDTTSTVYPWSADGSGKTSYSNDVGYNRLGCMKVTGATGDYSISLGDRFVMTPGCTYKVSGYMKLENCSGCAVRIDYGYASEYHMMNKDYLQSELQPFIDFSMEHNVPMYLGEFGVCVEGFKENRGGEQWVADMLSLCREYGLSFNYHTYHEASFGLYTAGNVLPSEIYLNRALYDCLVKELNR